MKLIVGLGNPGKEYDNTRHNMGFYFIDNFALKNNIKIDKKKFNGLYNELSINGEKYILLKPQTYMNLSGESVRKFVDFFKIDINDILIISDDMDIPIGTYRLKQKGSSGGHNGLKNIELNLGTQEYKRLKMGISKSGNIDTVDYVLGKLSKDDKEKIKLLTETVDKILVDFSKISFEELMSKYNHK